MTAATTTAFVDIIDEVTPQTLRDLAATEGPCVSVYLPTRRAQTDPDHDGLVLRGLLDRASTDLGGRGVRSRDVDALLAPARDLVADRRFWTTQAEGLALIAAPDALHILRLPVAPEASVRVGDHPHLLPLIPIAAGDCAFHVLAFSPARVRLFRGTRSRLAELPLGSIPASIEDMERRHQREKELQHQHAPQGRTVATFHGHGGPDLKGAALASYVKEVADGVRDQLGASATEPLVLAAVAEHLPLFRATGTLPMLVDTPVPGSPDTLNPGDLLERAWPVVEAAVAKRHTDVIAKTERALAHGRGESRVAEVVRASREGRIDTLVIGPMVSDVSADVLDDVVTSAVATGAELCLRTDVGAPGLVAILRYR
ncbi:MAG: hypothetical protein U0Q21_06865 [Dermatophilaceae bacterium]